MMVRAPRRGLPTRYSFAALATLLALALAVGFTGQVYALFTEAPSVPANTLVADTLQPLTGLGVSATGPGAADLSWTPTVSAYAEGYSLRRSLTAGSGYVVAATVPGQASSSHSDTGLQPGNTYYYVGNSYAGG
ncbi:MAG: hypothetical protein ACR2OD_00685, partial [Gaiellaceae bacterium]